MEIPRGQDWSAARVGSRVDAVVIGRNEGARLVACFESLRGAVDSIVYVDSGSTDGSQDLALRAGATLVTLDVSVPFTAARARNAGMAALEGDGAGRFVQFVDGDCAIRDGWIAAARAFLEAHPEAAVVCGRRRERFPGASIYNRLCDEEWDTPIGLTRACGGDSLARRTALAEVGGFRESLIAGEEPELCLRLRRAGWQIWRIDREMTWHDAAILRFGQWWKRTRRAGHAFAEGAALHGAPPERHWVRETRRALVWGIGVPLTAVMFGLFHPLGWLVLLAWPAQVARLALRAGGDRFAWARAFFAVLGKVAETVGVLEYWSGRLKGRRARLIEYK